MNNIINIDGNGCTSSVNNTPMVVITSDPNTELFPDATVEAEYGAVTVPGSRVTLAHHGENAMNPCPCLGESLGLGLGRWDIIQVSHFDLDTLGGVARCLDWKKGDWEDEDLFWKIAAKIDTQGDRKSVV